MISNKVIEIIMKIVGDENVITSKEERLCYAYDSTPNAFLPDLVFARAQQKKCRVLSGWLMNTAFL